jgi:hypothetical protein
MQDFCDFCGRDGLVLEHASVHALRGHSVPSAHGLARTHLHFDHMLHSRALGPGTEVVVFADLLDRARLKQAA